MDIGSVLSRAWEIIWKHKVLWIFGILAGCSGGNPAGNFRSQWQQQASPQVQQFFSQMPDWQIALLVGIAILIILVLVIIVAFLGTMGRIGLIRGTAQADQGATRLTLGELFNGSLPYFWRVFLLNLLVGLAFAVVVIIVFVGLAITLVGFICLIPLACLLVPIGWLISILIEQANNAIVLENLGIMQGLQRGWQVIRDNLGSIIVMGLILSIGVSLIGSLIIGLPLAALIIPAVLAATTQSNQAMWSALAVAGIGFLVYLPFLLVLSGILRSYIESAWTLTYLRLTRRPAAAEVYTSPAVP